MKIIRKDYSADLITKKYVQETHNGELLETTFVSRPEKDIICFSTQIGCPVRCEFCAAPPLSRSLEQWELQTQIWNVLDNQLDKTRPVLLSAMGTGEPFHTRDQVLDLADLFLDLSRSSQTLKREFRFAVSTAVPDLNLLKLFSDVLRVPVKVQISLHSANVAWRRRYMPRATRDLEQLRNVSAWFQQVEWNVVLIDGSNDSESDAMLLGSFFQTALTQDKYFHLSETVKLNRFNPIPGKTWMHPSPRREHFAKTLRGYRNINVELYDTDGSDIGAACGQLVSIKPCS